LIKKTYANEQGWEVGKAVTEIGSDLNGHRPKKRTNAIEQ